MTTKFSAFSLNSSYSISDLACAAVFPPPPSLCPSTSTESPVPLNLSFVKPPTSQCPVQQTPISQDLPTTTLKTDVVGGNPSGARNPSSVQIDRPESQGMAPKTGKKMHVFAVVKNFFSEITHKMTLLLLDLTKTYQQLYFRNKTAFYKKLQTTFSQKGYTLSSEKIRKKLTNMLTTYKRVKDRRRATGEGKQTWEYYTVSLRLHCIRSFCILLQSHFRITLCFFCSKWMSYLGPLE